jgi:hypothetical protein
MQDPAINDYASFYLAEPHRFSIVPRGGHHCVTYVKRVAELLVQADGSPSYKSVIILDDNTKDICVLYDGGTYSLSAALCAEGVLRCAQGPASIGSLRSDALSMNWSS